MIELAVVDTGQPFSGKVEQVKVYTLTPRKGPFRHLFLDSRVPEFCRLEGRDVGDGGKGDPYRVVRKRHMSSCKWEKPLRPKTILVHTTNVGTSIIHPYSTPKSVPKP